MQPTAENPRPPSPHGGVAERIWNAARTEFSRRGYHGARVQGIARGAGCNVALIYRHWASKRALYLDVLRSAWIAVAAGIAPLLGDGLADAEPVVAAHVDAMMRDPAGAQIVLRELLDGAPFLAQIGTAEPALVEPFRGAALAASSGSRRAVAALLVAGVAALVAGTHGGLQPLLSGPVPPEVWRADVIRLLVDGLGDGPAAMLPAAPTARTAP